MEQRKTSQILLPVEKHETAAGRYDIYPAFKLENGSISEGYGSLAKRISNAKNVIIDGYIGIFFDEFKRELDKELYSLGIKPIWFDVQAARKSEEEIEAMVEPFLGGDDPIFGTRATITLSDFFDPAKLAMIKPDKDAQMNILVGCGAALADWNATTVYIDLPKNELQFRARSGGITNLYAAKAAAPKKMYKRFYFVDWVVLNRHKKDILSSIDIVVDGQRMGHPTWAEGSIIREGLNSMAHNMFRVRPWFEPGAWGGSWIKKNIDGLEKNVPNYAWSFELIVPENGLIFESDGLMLEVSFDTLMFAQSKAVLGDCHWAFGDEFPLRMDFLDNFDGGNLSIQCHPRLEYTRKNFGEIMTQEETYYILDKQDDAVVYLGFKEDIKPAEFEAALTDSFVKNEKLDVDKYVQSVEAEKHALYLIPPGTLHSSGSGNLVLEISTTPYIFTFKMYDWLALDLDGSPRPLNIKRGMENLYFERKGSVVTDEHISKPTVLESGNDWTLWHLPTHAKHTYDVHRYHFNTSVDIKTDGKCHVMSLVEGESIIVETAGGVKQRINYLETFVVPAEAGSYRVTNESGREAMLVKAFIKDKFEF